MYHISRLFYKISRHECIKELAFLHYLEESVDLGVQLVYPVSHNFTFTNLTLT